MKEQGTDRVDRNAKRREEERVAREREAIEEMSGDRKRAPKRGKQAKKEE